MEIVTTNPRGSLGWQLPQKLLQTWQPLGGSVLENGFRGSRFSVAANE